MGMDMDAGCLAPRLAGVLPAVPTPFDDGQVDLDAFSAFCGHLLTQGVDGLVVGGTTGEGSALDAVELPIVLYDVPGRTGVPLSVELIETLARLPRVVGLKDASANLARPVRIRAKAGPAFIQLSGDDATFVAHLAQGGVGCVSVTANVAPACCAALLAAWRSGDRAEVAWLGDALDPLHTALFLESNPTPVKAALAQQGHMDAAPRLPLQPATPATQEAISRALATVMPIERELVRTGWRAACLASCAGADSVTVQLPVPEGETA